MEKKPTSRPLAAALGTTFAVTLAATPLAHAEGNPFAAVEYQGGYMLAADEAEAKCGASMGMGEPAAKGEAKADAGKAAGAAKDAAADKSGEGKCGGMGDQSKAHEGKCGN
jgi:uncharacterized low-complexity protein